MKIIISFFLLFSTLVFATAVDLSQTDMLERTINFVIFIAILWYFFAAKAKDFFASRREKIAERLSEVQERLKVAKNDKEHALRKLEEAREKANEILEVAKKEAYVIAQKIEEQSSIDIETMRKNTEVLMEFEQRKMQKEVVEEVLHEVFSQNQLNTAEYINILERKVV
ncbi:MULTISPECIES: F0F1 ATP synthase subunit B [unclassified Helicobacter]|uniref:F0F1 ATP synthase subunit B n=1 Tax=unclassified Helicobacter TaxID=2593540 RepID=UPI000CF196B8|nr:MULTISPECIES: F0F1 ATP synthase subunit B [unclassified Helicobacter]